VSHGCVAGYDVLATDGLEVLGTLGFFVPAALLVALVVYAVVRDRRLSAREDAEETDRAGVERVSDPPRAD